MGQIRSVPSSWHGWYLGVFALFTVFSAGYIGWEEFHNPENEGFYETFLAMGHAASPFVILSAGFAVITVEVIAMIGDRLFRRRYLKEGFQQGREEERRLWLDWDKRRKEAEAREGGRVQRAAARGERGYCLIFFAVKTNKYH